ncbi:GGDEF domain-containing protein [Vibrio sp. 16]|uniref:sensor domain-containing diguanylate cyclase n=1 Tax=Vibrio sp. 16 TaxID=391586 RepID=UPI002FEEC795
MKRLTHKIIFYYTIFTLLPLTVLGTIGFVFYYQTNLQSLNHQFYEVIESQTLNAVHAATELDTEIAQQVAIHISHVEHVTKVTLTSSVYDLVLSEVISTTDSAETEQFKFPLYDHLHNKVGSILVEKNTDAIGKSEIAAILPFGMLFVLSFLILGFLFSRKVLALLSKPFYDAQRYGYLMAKGEINVAPPEHQYVEFSALFASIDNLRERLLDNINELKKSEQRLNTSYNLTQVCQFVVDTKNKTIVRSNNEFKRHFGSTSDDVNDLQLSLIMRIANEQIRNGKYFQVSTLHGERSFHFNTTDSDDFIVECSALDVTSLIATKRELETQLITDSLTKIGNRVGFNRHIEKLERTPNQAVYFVMVDLNGFKPINDTYGHSAGDFLLKEIASRLHEQANSNTKVYRLGGDEFVLICEQAFNSDDATKLAKSLVATISSPIEYRGSLLHVSASIGIASKPKNHKDISAIIHNADLAMYEAKEKQTGWEISRHEPVSES